jgi:EAL domain-containing protein (putative c-di-GMP-specific phosphodiesterase class I)
VNKLERKKLRLTHWYQPIYQLKTGNVFGYEALVRDESPYGLSPMDIFKQAEKENCRNALDCRLLFKALNKIENKDKHMSFLNIFPSTLLEPEFLYWWGQNHTYNSSVVLEICENEPVSDWSKLKYTINELRNEGVKIALDDMGSGYSFFQHWIELSPDYIKLDGYYAAGLAQNLTK